MGNYTDVERREAEKVAAENDDLISLLSRRLGDALADGDIKRLTILAAYAGRIIGQALTMARGVQRAEENSAHA